MMPAIYVREDVANEGHPEIVLRPAMSNWKFKATEGKRQLTQELQAVLRAWDGVGDAKFSEIRVAAGSILLAWVISGRVEVPEPDCKSCNKPADHHVDRKCLFVPTRYEPKGMALEDKDANFVGESCNLRSERSFRYQDYRREYMQEYPAQSMGFVPKK